MKNNEQKLLRVMSKINIKTEVKNDMANPP